MTFLFESPESISSDIEPRPSGNLWVGRGLALRLRHMG